MDTKTDITPEETVQVWQDVVSLSRKPREDIASFVMAVLTTDNRITIVSSCPHKQCTMHDLASAIISMSPPAEDSDDTLTGGTA